MMNSQNKKKLQIVLLVLIAVLTLGIGYASITALNSIININGSVSANQENFKVYFTESSITEGKGTVSIDEDDATIGYFDITGLSKIGDYAEATYTVLNDSNGVGANISLQLTNSNNEYFKVTETVVDSQLQAGETTTVTVKVEMIKALIDTGVSTNITATLVATPIDNAAAIGEETNSKESSYKVYTTSSTGVYINQSIPQNVSTSSDFLTVSSQHQNPRKAILLETENDIITKLYMSFKENNEIYNLRGGVDETSLPDSDKVVYKKNKELLNMAIGSNKCTESTTNNTNVYVCNNGYKIQIKDNGEVEVEYEENLSSVTHLESCYILASEKSYCISNDYATGPS